MKHVNRENIRDVVTTHVSSDAALMTDRASLYGELGSTFASHETVDHSKGEYVRGDAHPPTNTAEGYFSQLKRSIDGTCHQVSERHLDRYLSEFDFRYNTRKMRDGQRTEEAIRKASGKRLRYEHFDKNPRANWLLP